MACETCRYMGNLVSVEEKGCFWVLSDSRKDRRMVAGGRRGGGQKGRGGGGGGEILFTGDYWG